ncbi:non-specific lipid-transfer protein 1-like [Punica granatum]|uniref:Non-specific lipid-transfer protein n=1 Tax=Punica granatum TaxID=22663 RepID=A0A6P8DI42_PUNGR|nr:non-specific lipid-transfer protein 1-like [Punica granatum]
MDLTISSLLRNCRGHQLLLDRGCYSDRTCRRTTFLNKLAPALLLCMVVTVTVAESTITCGQVTQSASPCVPYAQGAGVAPTAACCSGIQSLNDATKTTPDHQTACKCLKAIAGSISGINYGLSGIKLPGKCGVRVPYKICPSTDCSRVK